MNYRISKIYFSLLVFLLFNPLFLTFLPTTVLVNKSYQENYGDSKLDSKNPIININSPTDSSEPLSSRFQSSPPSSEDFNLARVYNYSPYLSRYHCGGPINDFIFDEKKELIYFAYLNRVGIYNPKNDSFWTLSVNDTIEDGYYKYVILDMAFAENRSTLYAGSTCGLFVINTNNWTVEHRIIKPAWAPYWYTPEDINYFWRLALDEQDSRLFIATYDGYQLFYLNNKTFANQGDFFPELLRITAGPSVFDSKTQMMYFISGAGLYGFNVSTKNNTLLLSIPGKGTGPLAFDPESNRLFIGYDGVIVFNCTDQTLIHHYLEIEDYRVRVISALRFVPVYGGLIVAGQKEAGIIIINCSSQEITFLNRLQGLVTDDIFSISNLIVNSSLNFLNYNLVIGSFGGFCFYNIKEELVTKKVIVDDVFFPSMHSPYISQLENGLWTIGTENYLNLFDPSNHSVIETYDYVNGFPQPTQENLVFIKETQLYSQTNSLFVATSDGLCVFNLSTEKAVKIYTTLDGLSHNWTRCLILDEKNKQLFIGTLNGLSILDLQEKTIDTFLSNSTANNSIDSLSLDSSNERLFVATDNHLQILDLGSMTFKTYRLGDSKFDKQIQTLYCSSETNHLFVGTANGLFLLDLKTLRIMKHFTSRNANLTSSIINTIDFDPLTEILFVGTYWGLAIYDVAHDFWINLNDFADLEQYCVKDTYIQDIDYYKDQLFVSTLIMGLFVFYLNDSDDDYLYDLLEEWIFRTNPQKADSDKDGFLDSEELWSGTDPLDSSSFPVKESYSNLWFLPIIVLSVSVVISILLIIVVKRGNSN